MTHFTDGEHDELLAFAKYFTGRVVLPAEPLETSFKELRAPAVRKKCPLKTAEEAILLNDMFASFLSCGKKGYVIAVSGGFGADGRYHIVGAGNAGRKGVRRPSNELCAVLARACTNFVAGSTEPPDPDDMSEILVAALDICYEEVARRLKAINTDIDLTTQSASYIQMLQELGLPPHRKFCSDVAVLKGHLKRWKELESEKKTMVATLYGQYLEIASDLWDKIKNFEYVELEPHKKFIRGFNSISKGLRLLRRFPRGTRVVFDWPQGPINSDPFRCRPANAKTALWQTVIEGIINKSATRDRKLRKRMRMKWKEAIKANEWVKAVLHTEFQLHCEIYLALYILFSNSNVLFHSFQVEERKQFFTIGCSKESCISCWDILLGLSRQDSPSHPIHMCRTHASHGKCYKTWGLTTHIRRLPPSLVQAITGLKRTQMIDSLNLALSCSHQKFKQRVESSM